MLRARTQFALAKALWAQGRAGNRARAIDLGQRALLTFSRIGKKSQLDINAASEWLESVQPTKAPARADAAPEAAAPEAAPTAPPAAAAPPPPAAVAPPPQQPEAPAVPSLSHTD